MRLFIIALLLANLVFGQNYNFSYNTINYNINNGFPSSEVYFGLKDSKNFLWFSTSKGITRYNGIGFTTFNIKDGLSDNTILGAFEDDNNDIWFYGENNTVNKYNCKTNELQGYKHNNLLLKKQFNSTPLAVFKDKKDNVYLVSNKFGYVSISKEGKFKNHNLFVVCDPQNGFYVYKNQKYVPVFWRGETINDSLFENLPKLINTKIYSNENWLIFSESGPKDLKIYDLKKKVSHDYNGNATINSVTLNKFSDNILLSTDKGLIKYFINTKETVKYLTDNKINYALDNSKSGFFALSENNGVFNIKNNEILSFYKNEQKFTKPISHIFKNKKELQIVLEDESTNLIYKDYFFKNTKKLIDLDEFVDSNSKTFNKPLEVKVPNFYKFANSKALQSFNILSVTKNKKEVFILTKSGIYKIIGTSIIKLNALKTIDYWATSLSFYKNTLWIGTQKGLYNYKKNKLYKSNWISENYAINVLQNYLNKKLIIATKSYGIITYNGNKTTSFTEKNGLLSNLVNDLEINNNNIWVATNLGINKLQLNDNNKLIVTDVYSTSDGLNSTDITSIKVIDNTIFATSKYGLNLIKPYRKTKKNLKLYIEDIFINDTKTPLKSNLNIPNNNSLEVNLMLTSYNSQNPSVYYRIKELNPEFRETKNLNLIFESLPSGTYNLEYYAQDYIEKTAIETLTLTVDSPFFLRWYIFIPLCLIIGFLLYLIISIYIKKLKEKYEKEQEINRYKLLAFNKQMSSHFISNSFNAINNFILKNDNVGGSKYLSRMSKLFRHSLQSTEKTYIPFNKEIEALESYLDLEKLRYNDSFTYKIIISEKIKTNKLSIMPLVLQTLIENAIWHGLLPSTQPHKKITIDINNSEHSNLLKIKIIDNGIGINTEQMNKENSKGIQLVRNILETNHYTRKIKPDNILTFDFYKPEEQTNKGTICSIYLPIINEI